MARPETYEVQQVLDRSDPWSGNKGQMVTYEFLLADSSTKWKSSVLEDDDPGLEDGGTVKGWKNEDGKFGMATGSSNGAKRGSKDSSDDYSRSPDHPQTQERMRHTTALSAAPAYVEQMLTLSVIPQPKDKDEYVKTVEGVVTWLESTYPAADGV